MISRFVCSFKQVEEVGDVEAALKLLHADRFDVIVVDVAIPNWRSLLQPADAARVCVVVLGDADEDDITCRALPPVAIAQRIDTALQLRTQQLRNEAFKHQVKTKK